MALEYSNYGGMHGLKSFSWAIAHVFAEDGGGHILTCCESHFPLEITDDSGAWEHISADSEQVSPIFASDEMDYFPTCEVCGETHTYVNLTSDGVDYEMESLDFQISDTASPSSLEELYARRDELIDRFGLDS